MSTSAEVEPGNPSAGGEVGIVRRARLYFASDRARALQTALGLVWLLDGALQFQSFMYSHGFVAMLLEMAPGQPLWLTQSIEWAAHVAEGDLGLFNTMFSLTQILLGLGLLWGRSVKPALAVSFLWVLVVWWFGEAFGMIFIPTMISPLTGAPGAVLIYAVIGAIVWPSERPGGLLGQTGARAAWAGLWIFSAYLWLGGGPSSGPNATRNAIEGAPSGMGWLTALQEWAYEAARHNGYAIALVLGILSLAIGIGVFFRRTEKLVLALAISLQLLFWVIGQGFGGIFEGGATDPNAGIMFVLLALAMPIADDNRTQSHILPACSPAGRSPSRASPH